VVDRPARPQRAGGKAGLARGLIAAVEGLAQHRLLDRLIRGRTWIGLVAFALIGIVTLQLGLLKLNGGIGRALEHAALLQRENAALSIENSEMAAGNQVETRATHLGMAFVPSGSLRFLAARPHSDAAKAAAALTSAGHSSAAGTGETTSGGSTEPKTSTESPSTESPSTEPAASTGSSAGESSASQSAGESHSSTSAPEGSTASAESTTAPRTAPAPTEAADGSGGESSPAGGTQPSSPGG
jgi:hypothetical protein